MNYKLIAYTFQPENVYFLSAAFPGAEKKESGCWLVDYIFIFKHEMESFLSDRIALASDEFLNEDEQEQILSILKTGVTFVKGITIEVMKFNKKLREWEPM